MKRNRKILKSITIGTAIVGLNTLRYVGWAEETTSVSEQSSSSITASTSTQIAANANSNKIVRTGDLKGKNIMNSKSENLGSLEDFVIDIDTGMIKYALIDVDKGLAAQRFVAVPINRFSRGSAGELMVRLEKSELAAAPKFDSVFYVSNPNWNLDVDNYYNGLTGTFTPTGVDDAIRNNDASISSGANGTQSSSSVSEEHKSATEQTITK